MFMIENFTSQTPLGLELIHEKISLPAQVGHIPRPRLLNLLHESLKFRLSTIIQGRAGSGKTVLATDFAGRCGPLRGLVQSGRTGRRPAGLFPLPSFPESAVSGPNLDRRICCRY